MFVKVIEDKQEVLYGNTLHKYFLNKYLLLIKHNRFFIISIFKKDLFYYNA